MAINPDIRDQAYQFFIEEAPELLQVIEAGLLTIRQEHSTANVHNLMRAAHSIKGGAASVELEAIASLAHRLETLLKVFYDEALDIDTDLESQLLQAYDCLRLPLMEQITTGYFDPENALALADPIFTRLEERFGDALAQVDSYMPSSADLGIDMTKSIFEVDVQEGLDHLTTVIAHPQDYEVAGELRAQAEVFAGFAELLNRPEFGVIAKTTLAALEVHPDRALLIAQLALTDFQRSRQAVLGINPSSAIASCELLTGTYEIAPSEALVALANPTATQSLDITPTDDEVEQTELIIEDTTSLDDLFGNALSLPELVGENIPIESDEDQLEETFTAASEWIVDNKSVAKSANPEVAIPELIDFEWVETTSSEFEEVVETPLLEEVFGNVFATSETETQVEPIAEEEIPTVVEQQLTTASQSPITNTAQTLEGAVQSIEEIFNSLPPIQDILTPTSVQNSAETTADNLVPAESISQHQLEATPLNNEEAAPTPQLSVRVDSNRLGRMNNLVGELAINRNGLSLQNEQLQGSVRELLNRFTRVQTMVGQLQAVSDQMLVSTSSAGSIALHKSVTSVGRSWLREPHSSNASGKPTPPNQPWSARQTNFNDQETTDNSNFDSLELDSYGFLHSQLQGLLDDMVQLEEAVDDIVLFAKATDQSLEQQRQMLTQLRDELMWARMLPLGEVLNRYPRMLRDLSTTYRKPVSLKLSGTSVLVDKAVLEKLYDPLLHLLRNAFDHGIESPEIRRQGGKSEEGRIEVRAYHQGSQTIIEVRDDGQGLNLERIRTQAQEMGLLSAEQAARVSSNRLFELIFEPGFSTASQVSELSGRGVGLDVVRSQMQSLKGTITVSSSPGVGTTFTLRLPLTLTIAKLLVCFMGSTALAMPSDGIEEIIVPASEQIKESGRERFLHWRGQIIPIYRLANLLDYACPLPDTSPSKALISVASPTSWALPLLILRQGQQVIAMEIDRLVTEQELVIKPFGSAIAPPSFTYGCTILGDGSLIPVIDATVLLDQILTHGYATTATTIEPNSQRVLVSTEKGASASKTVMTTASSPIVLVVDDAVALRRTLALTLERVGFRVLQAKDGREAIDQLQQTPSVNLVVCDIEMPNMNGFEFLSCRRQDSELSKIPVVMLTSRSNDKHRWLAMQLGATAYFTKPYLEQEFVTAIKQIINQDTPEPEMLLASHTSR